MTRKEVDRGNEEEAQEGRQEQAGVLTEARRRHLTEYSQNKAIAVLLARRNARRRVVTDGRVAASLQLYESALERAK